MPPSRLGETSSATVGMEQVLGVSTAPPGLRVLQSASIVSSPGLGSASMASPERYHAATTSGRGRAFDPIDITGRTRGGHRSMMAKTALAGSALDAAWMSESRLPVGALDTLRRAVGTASMGRLATSSGGTRTGTGAAWGTDRHPGHAGRKTQLLNHRTNGEGSSLSGSTKMTMQEANPHDCKRMHSGD